MPLPAGIAQLAVHELDALAAAFDGGRLAPPFTRLKLEALGIAGSREAADGLSQLIDAGFPSSALSVLLGALADERRRAAASSTAVEVVVTGPDVSAAARDTAVVCRELFRGARRHVLVVGFAVYQGRDIFRHLAERLDADPGLEAMLCFDISRSPGDTSLASDIVARFARRFVEKEWPGHRLPALYYDPRSLLPDRAQRTSLHAKCVVVDKERALVTSANFTEAAHARNIELGLVVRSPQVARDIVGHFEALIATGTLVPIAPTVLRFFA